MTHDPLCHIAQDCSVFLENAGPHNTPFIDDPDLECWCGQACQCGLIDKVRDDEREQTIRDCITEVEKVGSRAAHNGFSRVGPLEVIAAVSTLQRQP